MAPGSSPRLRVPAVMRSAALVVPLVLAAMLAPAPAWAVGPRSMDAAPTYPFGGSRTAGGSAPDAPPPSGQPPVVVFHGPRTSRVIALTFDDGYAPANVRLIFEELTRANVTATFFVNGAYMRWDPQLWRSIAAAGFPIGNHTVIHQDVRGRPPAQVEADLARNARIVQQVTGRPMIPVFRPPYGDHDATSDAAAAAAGFPTIVLWDVSGGDADLRATDASVLANASLGRPGSIVLLHAGPSVTPRILPALIAAYQARGFTFVTVPQLLGIASASAAAPSADGAPPAPDPAGAAAPTPPAVLPIGDDRGSPPVSVGSAGPSADPVAASSSEPAATAAAGQATSAQGAGADPAPSSGAEPATAVLEPAGSPGAAASPALARDSAWARGAERQSVVVGITLVLLVGLLVIGAIAGSRARRGG